MSRRDVVRLEGGDLSSVDALDAAEVSILELVPAAARHLLLDYLPVLAVLIYQLYQQQVVLDRPIVPAQVGPQVVLVVVLQLLVVAV